MPADTRPWPDPHLVGNGWACLSCEGTGRVYSTDSVEYASGRIGRFRLACPACRGLGRQPLDEREVYDRTKKGGEER